VLSGAARPAQNGFLVVHLLMTLAFIVAGRTSLRAEPNQSR
jgi:hypothetical protein